MFKFLKKMMGGNEEKSPIIPENKVVVGIKERPASSPQPQVDMPKISTNKERRLTFRAPPVISDPTQRGIDKEFRLEDDYQNIIRINQTQPQGFPKKIAEFVTVVGITKENRDIPASQFIQGQDRRIELVKQPDNPYDKNAIEVYGLWTEQGKSFREKLGYIPSKVASKLINESELKATIKVMYTPTDETSLGIRIDIWTKMKKREKVEEKPYEKMETPQKEVDRNSKGQELEKAGYIDNAIELYELNIKEEFGGNFPYDRLTIIYRKRKMVEDEIRVLEQAIKVFKSLEIKYPHQDTNPKLTKFREQLAKIISK